MLAIAVFAVFVSLVTIVPIRQFKQETKVWAYPMTLASYPVFYLGFALSAQSSSAFWHELVWAVPFWGLCLIVSLAKWRWSMYLLGMGFIAHGLYDGVHASIVVNPGMPHWWPLFCFIVDGIVGVYLLVIATKYKVEMEAIGKSNVAAVS